MARTIRKRRDTKGQRNRDRAVVKVTSAETRVIRRARRRAENAEINGQRAGKQAVRAMAGGHYYA